MTVTLRQIQDAKKSIERYLSPTPTVRSSWLSTTLQADVFLKLETLHPTGSFKVRGVCHALDKLPQEKRAKGVIAMSAGNHAQALAYFARHMGIPATIVMPQFASFTKVQRTESLGAHVVLKGETLSEAGEVARQIARQEGLTLVHPYDDEEIIAGQGTVGVELIDTLPDLDVVLVPVGGGGLIAGVAAALKAHRHDIEILGVQTTSFPTMKQALEGTPCQGGGLSLADGISVKTPGTLTVPMVKKWVSDILLVHEDAVEHAIFRLMTEQKIVAEGAGAVGVAALLSYPHLFKGRRVATLVSGGNIDSRLLSLILMRGLAREGHLVRLRIGIQDVPGSLSHVSSLIAEQGGNIIEVEHHRFTPHVMVKNAELDVVIETRDHDHIQQLVTALRQARFKTEILSEID